MLNLRGLSYPPPSPRGLTRSPPVPQSRNPPLVKTKNHSVSSTCAFGCQECSCHASVEATNVNVDLGSLMSKIFIRFCDTVCRNNNKKARNMRTNQF